MLLSLINVVYLEKSPIVFKVLYVLINEAYIALSSTLIKHRNVKFFALVTDLLFSDIGK